MLFAGYSSAITVAVRAGFDKPGKIFRGAFGKDIALPVWVDVMNASVARYPAEELKKPASIQSVEICSKSGLLATEKCPTETTYRELATREQMPTDPCSVHGDARTRIARDLPDAGVPRAELAVDTNQVKPVAVKGPTLLAENDPYNAVRSTVRPPKPEEPAENEVKPAIPVDEPPAATALPPEDDPTILRAQPVAPGDVAPEATPVPEEDEEVRRAEPVLRAEPVDPSDRAPQQDLSAPIFGTPVPDAREDQR